MGQDAVEGSRDTLEVECLDEEHGVPLLAVPQEAVELLLERSRAMCGLPLVGPERTQLALLREHALHPVRPDRPRQLVLEVARASVEADVLELVAVFTPERAQEVALLADVVEPREPDVAVVPEQARQVPVAAHRHDDDTLGVEVPAAATRERLDGTAIARAFDEHGRAQLHTSIRSGRRGAGVSSAVVSASCDLPYDHLMAGRLATCSCGQLEVATEGEPLAVYICHCLECQRRTGSVFAGGARFLREHVRVRGRSSEFVRVSDMGEGRTFHFCPECGTTVYWTWASAPEAVSVAVGAFADPTFPPPVVSVFERRRHPWLDLAGAIARHEGSARPQPSV